jgi:hypothetical protein
VSASIEHQSLSPIRALYPAKSRLTHFVTDFLSATLTLMVIKRLDRMAGVLMKFSFDCRDKDAGRMAAFLSFSVR